MLKKILFLTLILILPQFVMARGSMESEREYTSQLKTTFEQILIDHEAGEITSLEARKILLELRDQYNKPYNDEYGIMEALLDQLEENSLSYNEARHDFSLLQVGKLMEYRQERQRSESDSHKNETKSSDEGNDSGREQKNDDTEQDKGNGNSGNQGNAKGQNQ